MYGSSGASNLRLEAYLVALGVHSGDAVMRLAVSKL